MENQHRKIVGYRELSQEDIDLMNRIKAAGRELLALHDEVADRCRKQIDEAVMACFVGKSPDSAEAQENARLIQASPLRWAAIAKTDLQTGVMALVRAVAQPTDC